MLSTLLKSRLQVARGTPMGRESAAGCLWSMSVVNVAIKEACTVQVSK